MATSLLSQRHQVGVCDQNRGYGPTFLWFPFLLPLLLSPSENFYQIFSTLSLPSFLPSLLSLVSSRSRTSACYRGQPGLAASYWTPAMEFIIVHGPKPNEIHWWHWLSFTVVWSVTLSALIFSNLSLTLCCHLCHLPLSIFS